MEAIGETIKSLIHEWEFKKNNPISTNPEFLLKKLLTKRELQHIKFNYFRKGILGISVDSSGWLYHLSLKKEGLLISLQKNLTDLKEIHFRLGEVDG